MIFAAPQIIHDGYHSQNKGEQSAGANRRGCCVAHAFRNSNPPSRLHAHPRPSGRHSLDVGRLNAYSIMADSIPMLIEFEGDGTLVEFPDEQATAKIELRQVGPRLFRIVSVPLMIEAVRFGDIIEAEACTDGGLRFVRVAEPGGWRTYDFLLSADMIESERITTIKERVLSLEGHCERVCGGILFLCLPPTTDYDPTEDMLREP